MSQLFIYFTAATAEEALQLCTTDDTPIYENSDIDKLDEWGVEPIVNLGQLVAIILDVEWDVDMVEETNIYPPGPEPSFDDWMAGLPEDSPWHGGRHCIQLKNKVQEALSKLREKKDDAKSLAQDWSKIEEWHGHADVVALEKTIRDLSSLASRAEASGQNLYVYFST